MKLRQVLAQRLRDLMDTTPGLETQMQVSARAGISQTTVSRILKSQVAATLDNVEAIATAYGLSPSALLSTQTTAKLPVISEADRRTMHRIAAYLAISEGGTVSARTTLPPREGAVKSKQTAGRSLTSTVVHKKIEGNTVSKKARKRRDG